MSLSCWVEFMLNCSPAASQICSSSLASRPSNSSESSFRYPRSTQMPAISMSARMGTSGIST